MASRRKKSETTSPTSGLLAAAEQTETPLPVMQIANWPLRDDRVESIWVLVLVAVLSFIAARVGDSVYLGVVVGACLIISVWRMLAPIRYELDARGVQQICAGRRRFTAWSDFASYRFDPNGNGVMLLHEEGPLALNALRGVFIHAGDRREELESLVAFYLPIPTGSDAQASVEITAASSALNRTASTAAKGIAKETEKGAVNVD